MNPQMLSVPLLCACVCVCVFICTSVWVTHQSRASLKMLNRNANGNANAKAIVNANEEYLKGQPKRKCWQKVVGNWQRKHRKEMKLKLELELEAAVQVGVGVGVKCGNENGVGPECGDRLNSPAYKHKHVGYCLQQQQHPRRAQLRLQLPVLPRLLFLHFILSICQLFNQQHRQGEGWRERRESHTTEQANNQLYPKA